MARNIFLTLGKLAEVRAQWLDAFKRSPLATEYVPVQEAYGRTLADSVAAELSSPAFHGAAMDGIAVQAVDTFGASEGRPKRLNIGENAFWINTGHPLPPNTNAVIMVEQVIPDMHTKGGAGERVIIEKAAFPWQHVRKMGEDMVATEILLPQGTLVGAYELGALAAAGVLQVPVIEKPKVAISPSGSELVPLEKATQAMVASGQYLPEFNSVVLAALVRDCGGEAKVYPIVPDDKDIIASTIQQAVNDGVHLVAINAGSSAGSKDYTAEVIASLGEVWVHGINIMPGKPTVLGKVDKTPIMGVPGYPVSAIIAFEELGQPLLTQWQHKVMPQPQVIHAEPFQGIPSRPGMEEFVRVKVGKVAEKYIAIPLSRGAGTVTSLSKADGIIRIPEDLEGVLAHQPFPTRLIRSEKYIDGALLAIGSHDNTLDLLGSMLCRVNPAYSLTSAHVGSMGGLIALKEGRCHVAGSHLLDEATGIYNKAFIQEHLQGIPLMQVRLVDREQGLMVMPGNPKRIATIEDLLTNNVRFINRQRGSGTRVLLDYLLAQKGLSARDMVGYDEEEYTHMNVAVAVISGRADAGLGVRSAANALGLDFIPVGNEEYDLLIPLEYAEDERVLALLSVIRSEDFTTAVSAMGGYGVEKTGEIIWTFEG